MLGFVNASIDSINALFSFVKASIDSLNTLFSFVNALIQTINALFRFVTALIDSIDALFRFVSTLIDSINALFVLANALNARVLANARRSVARRPFSNERNDALVRIVATFSGPALARRRAAQRTETGMMRDTRVALRALHQDLIAARNLELEGVDSIEAVPLWIADDARDHSDALVELLDALAAEYPACKTAASTARGLKS